MKTKLFHGLGDLLHLLVLASVCVQAQDENLQWSYWHPQTNVSHLISSSLAATNDQTAGRFLFHQGENGLVAIEINSNLETEPFLYIDIYRALSKTSNSSGDHFTMIPFNGVILELFSLSHNGEPIVTPMSRPPFSFFAQSRYPGYDPAVFFVAPFDLDIEESYGGQRNNILPTAALIQELDHVDKQVGYSELLRLMSFFGHVAGKEIFELGDFIVRNNAWDLALMELLPVVVQSVLNSGNSSARGARLVNRDPVELVDLPMKSVTAGLNQTFVTPYSFRAEGPVWAITYWERYQLTVASGSLSSQQLDSLKFEFILNLTESLDAFFIQSAGSGEYLERYSWSSSEYRFRLSPSGEEPAYFSAAPYYIDIEQLYGNDRANILPAARFIEAFSNDAPERDGYYDQLLTRMQNAGQMEGFEIFELGEHMSNCSASLDSLPSPVRTICSGTPVRLALETDSGGVWSLNGSRAYENSGAVLPYTISPAKLSGGQRIWSITYSQNIQLTMVYSGLGSAIYDFLTRTQATKFNQFKFYLHANLTSLHILGAGYQGGIYSLRSILTSAGNYRFETERSLPPVGATFLALPYAINVSEWYEGKRQNILTTAEFIRDARFVEDEDKLIAYEELIRQIGDHGHLEGKEVFELGAHLYAASRDYLVNLLPKVVAQVLGAGSGASGIYYTASSVSYPFKHSWASDLHSPSSYSFAYASNVKRFAVTVDESNEWAITFGDLIDIRSDEKFFSFQLHLAENLEDVHIHCYYNSTYPSSPLVTRNADPDFYFCCDFNSNQPRDLFSIRSTNA